MADDDERPIRLVPRGPLDEALTPTGLDRIRLLERDASEIVRRLVAVEQAVVALTKPQVEAIYPQNPWRLIAQARISLAEKHRAGEIDDTTYDEAMANLAASERWANVGVETAEAIIVDLDERRGAD